MGMSLDDLAPCVQRRRIKSVRQLTKTTAGGRNQTALLQHAAGGKAAPSAGDAGSNPTPEEAIDLVFMEEIEKELKKEAK